VILRRLAAKNFAVAPDEILKQFRPTVLRIVQRDIIGDLSQREYLFLNVLSVFRHFQVGIILKLIDAGLLPKDLMGGKKSTIDGLRLWLNGLCETPALIRRNPSHPFAVHFSVHPVLRHVLPMDLEFSSPDNLRRLHFEAYKIYDRSLRERDAADIHLRMSLATRPVCTMEALYHAIQGQLVAVPVDQKEEFPLPSPVELAEEYWRLYADSYIAEDGGFARDPFLLCDQWEQDVELQELIERLENGREVLSQVNQVFGRDPKTFLTPAEE
jgi:hypothetical protein